LETDHTLEHSAEAFCPHLLDRRHYEGWIASGDKTSADRAHAKLKSILAEHHPQITSNEVRREVRMIVEKPECRTKRVPEVSRVIPSCASVGCSFQALSLLARN
jgi:trimethylamine:corrinoid methyltransferase-like protein